QRHQQVIVNAYFGECQRLAQVLSQSASRVAVLPALRRRIDEYMTLLPGSRSVAPARHDQMPYRVFFTQVAERLRQTWDMRAGRYERAEQFRADLVLAAQSLLANHGANAGYQLVRRLLTRLDTFGFHLATLELKQHADVHHQVIAQGLDDARWLQRSGPERFERLAQMLTRDEGPLAPLDALGRRTLQVFEAALQGRSRMGERAIGSYVVADVRGPEDMLAPLVLARWAGAENAVLGEANLDFSPMFESAESLANAGQTMRQLLTEPNYAAHLRARGGPQNVLVGYSRGARDSGLLATRMTVFEAQRDIAQAVSDSGFQFVICHARGGNVARGGSRIDALAGAAPPESVTGVLRLTEQGETISQNYGLRANALRTLERAFGALAPTVLARKRGVSREAAATHDNVRWIADRSREVWRQRMMQDRGMADFFRAVTPIDVIERMQVGSRTIWEATPFGRGMLLAVRSTPWVFAWSQARYFAPGWFGAGAALTEGIERFGLEALRRASADWPFFSLLLADIESQLARADMDIAGHYVELASPPLRHHAQELREEYQRCCEAVLAIGGSTELLDQDRTQQRAIQLRNPYVDPMHLMQVDLLRRWRATARADEDLFSALLASVSGIAQGLQTTG
ncbi:MAG: phosphoenolpyruvate carboxylase, partial [Nevskiaceae bacterium]|nr:phosphoenolpyruvate carboxylase [Nevskiaceae bacterium]